MTAVTFPYGKGNLRHQFPEERLSGVLTSQIESYTPPLSGRELVRQALENPVGSPRLSELTRDKQRIVVIASDHTRPVPSKVIMPLLLEEIRRGNPQANITILVATGCHRTTTKEELIAKFGKEIAETETILIHDCDCQAQLTDLGILPSGGQCLINKLAVEADLLVAEGFIEPHFFAGFSGGRKSVLPGIAGRETVLANHCSEFIADPRARTGVLENNPIHTDMVWAARQAKLAFIVNVVLNGKKEIIHAVAGDMEDAHRQGTDFLTGLCGATAATADVVITTNGGYPLDQNVYQAVKGMTAAEATVRKDGVIIMLAASNDGIGGDHFYRQLAGTQNIAQLMDTFLQRGRTQTEPDQWQTQILLRVLMHARVIYVSEMPADVIKAMHMTPASSLEEALEKAAMLLGTDTYSITAIPDGVSVIVST